MPPPSPRARPGSVLARAAPLLALLLGGCAPAEPDARGPSILLVSVDTLRADHLGAYGHHRPASPCFDAFRRDAVLFHDAIAHAPSTLPSHASLFSSLLPQHHGASFRDRRPLPEELTTLAEALRRAGYRTAAFTGGGHMAPAFGLDQGFERYEVVVEDRLAATVAAAGEWLREAARERPFFLFLHTYEVHHPYTPSPEDLRAVESAYDGPLPDSISVELLREVNLGRISLTPADREHIGAAYAAEIRSADRAFGRLLESLRQRALYRETVVALTSDHGEELGEHGAMGWHSHTLYDELLRVPLAIKLPGNRLAGGGVTAQVRSIDVAPTLLELAGVPVPETFSGESLLPLMRLSAGGGEAPDPALPAVALRSSRRSQEAIRVDGWKLYEGRLYDLRRDPVETTDVAAEHPEVVRRLEVLRRQLLEAREGLEAAPVTLDREEEERLRALGYVE